MKKLLLIYLKVRLKHINNKRIKLKNKILELQLKGEHLIDVYSMLMRVGYYEFKIEKLESKILSLES